MQSNNKEVLDLLNNNMSNLRSGLYADLTTKIATNEAEEVAKTAKVSKER